VPQQYQLRHSFLHLLYDQSVDLDSDSDGKAASDGNQIAAGQPFQTFIEYKLQQE
jgi:hypothetical protein